MFDCFVWLFFLSYILCICTTDIYWLQQFSDIMLKLLGSKFKLAEYMGLCILLLLTVVNILWLFLTVDSPVHFNFCNNEEKQNKTNIVCFYETSSRHWTFFLAFIWMLSWRNKKPYQKLGILRMLQKSYV